jgi:hypothetical protein
MRALSFYQSSRWPPDLKSQYPLGPGKEPGYIILFFKKKSPCKRIPPRVPDDTDYVSGKINTIKETTEAILVASREVYLEANKENSAGCNHKLKIAEK